MKLVLADRRFDVAAVLSEAFRTFGEVTVHHGDLLTVAENAVVSPANGYGFMDGGIDEAYFQFFGPGIEQTVQRAIAERPEGHLPVGASLLVHTGHAQIPYMIVAPTMLMPEAVSVDHAYRAFRAVLRLVTRYPELLHTVYCPGLCTGVGAVGPSSAAEAMAAAFRDWKTSRP